MSQADALASQAGLPDGTVDDTSLYTNTYIQVTVGALSTSLPVQVTVGALSTSLPAL
jgi:hypothetical protein